MAIPNWSDAALDGGADYIAANASRVDVCSQEPASLVEATSTYSLANYSLSGGDWSQSAGDVSGRKLTLAEQSGGNGTADGTAACLAFTDGSVLVGVIAAGSESVNSGAAVTISAVDVVEFRDPT